MLRPDDLEHVARTVIDCGYHLHRDLGPGLLESAYEVLLAEAIRQTGLAVQRQVPVTMSYKGVVIDNAFKVDLLVEDSLVIELKSIERLVPVHGKQVLTYPSPDAAAARPADELWPSNLQGWPPAHRQ